MTGSTAGGDARSSHLLGAIQGLIGFEQETVPIAFGIGAGGGDPLAHGHELADSGADVGNFKAIDHSLDAAGHGKRSLRVGIGKDENELVATVTGGEVGGSLGASRKQAATALRAWSAAA